MLPSLNQVGAFLKMTNLCCCFVSIYYLHLVIKNYIMKTLLALLIVVLLAGCSESTEPGPELQVKEDVATFLRTKGLDASSPEDIQYISDFKDSLGFTLVWGMKDSAAWVAKYGEAGDELFSFVLADWEGGRKYSHTNKFSMLKIEGGLIFMNSYATDDPDPKATINYYNTILSVLDLSFGVELSRIPVSEGQNGYSAYRIYPHEHGFIAEERGQYGKVSFSSIGLDGSMAWSRATMEHEKTSGIKSYSEYVMTGAEKMVYNSGIREYGIMHQSYCLLNFRTYEVMFNVRKSRLPFDVIGSESSDMSYQLYSASEIEGKIILKYNYRQRTKIIDNQATGAFHYEYTTLSKHFCELNGTSGAVIGSGVLQ